jgi:hypothetical protein
VVDSFNWERLFSPITFLHNGSHHSTNIPRHLGQVR